MGLPEAEDPVDAGSLGLKEAGGTPIGAHARLTCASVVTTTSAPRTS